MAGAFVALVTLFVLSTIGAAVGPAAVSELHGPTVATRVWSVLGVITAFFLGGWATSQCVARETRREGAFYGVVLWGVTYLVLLFLGLNGIFATFTATLGIDGAVASHTLTAVEAAELATVLDLSPDQVTTLEALVRANLGDIVVAATPWWTVLSVGATVAAAMLGAIVGSGRVLSLRGVLLGHRSRPGVPT